MKPTNARKERIRPERKKWSEQTLDDAMKAVAEGQSVKSAARNMVYQGKRCQTI